MYHRFSHYSDDYRVTLPINSITPRNDIGSCHTLAKYGLTFSRYCVTDFCDTATRSTNSPQDRAASNNSYSERRTSLGLLTGLRIRP